MRFSLDELDVPAAESSPAIAWEEVNCRLCGSQRSKHLLEAADHAQGGSGLWFAVVKCQECGLCFTNPRPTSETIGQFYPASYQPHQTRKKEKGKRKKPERARRLSSLFPFRSNERQVLPLHGSGRLLDFGCGGGSYLQRMHHQGWHVTGLDMSETAVARVRSQLGLNALTGTLPHPQLQPASFDVITMWQALEHVHEPLLVLREAHRLLAPAGKLLVAVPNIDSLPFRWFRHAWYGLDLPRHLTHFAPATLTQMLHKAGFRMVSPVRMLRHSDWLRSSAKLACQSSRKPHWLRWLKLKPASRLATWYSYLTHQTDCMMVTALK